VLLLVGGVAHLAPATASASCGDYLEMPRHLASPLPQAPIAPTKPACRGPHCRSSLPPVLPSRPVTTERILDRGVWVLGASLLPPLATQPDREVADAQTVEGIGQRIDRPPRRADRGR